MSNESIDLGKYKDYVFTPQQRNMIRKGLAAGIDVSDYADPKYDYLQMDQILLCKMAGVDPSIILDPEIPYQSMEKTRLKLFDQQQVAQKEREKVKSRRQKRVMGLTMFLMFLLAVGGGLYANKEAIQKAMGTPFLELKENTIQLGLSEVSAFDSLDYVADYAEDFELIAPEYDFSAVGEYDLKYEITNGAKNEVKMLHVYVYDDVSPVIELSKTNLVLEYGSGFNAKDYLLKATDNVDNDITAKVEIESNVETSKSGDYIVSYLVADQAGNEDTKELKVHVNEKVVEKAPETTNPSTSSGAGAVDSTPDNGNTKPSATLSNPGQYNKYFDGNNIDNYNKAMEYAQDIFNKDLVNGYTVMPTGNGYQVTFS